MPVILCKITMKILKKIGYWAQIVHKLQISSHEIFTIFYFFKFYLILNRTGHGSVKLKELSLDTEHESNSRILHLCFMNYDVILSPCLFSISSATYSLSLSCMTSNSIYRFLNPWHPSQEKILTCRQNFYFS